MKDLLAFPVSFLLMEIISWLMHKYLMHGALWSIHKTHHHPGKSFFQWNDLFSLVFGALSIFLIFSGIQLLDIRFWAGMGIATYGILYFFLHDLIIHQRIPFLRNPSGRYLKALIRAHKLHHKNIDRDGSEAFGLLWVNGKYFK